jgi:hypothetical protein
MKLINYNIIKIKLQVVNKKLLGSVKYYLNY